MTYIGIGTDIGIIVVFPRLGLALELGVQNSGWSVTADPRPIATFGQFVSSAVGSLLLSS